MNRQTKRTLTILGMLLVVVALPGIVLLSRSQQTYQQSAHTPTPSATAVCQGSTVVVSSSYVITSVPSGVTCKVTANDSQSYLDDSFSAKNGDAPHTKSVNTQQATISPGVVTFKTSCSDGFAQTNQASYSLKTPCSSPTPTPTVTPKPSQSPTPTVTPSITPTPTQVITPTPMACQVNKSLCSWSADSNAVSYHYQVFNITGALLTEGDVQAPATSVQFPSTTGQSYKCSVTGINACGTGQAGVGTFTCNITPTPSLCVTLPAPQNIKVSCPNCN